MSDKQQTQLFTVAIDAGDYNLIVGYAYDLDAAKDFAVNRPLSDYEEYYLTLEEVAEMRGPWEWKERITSYGTKHNGHWTNGVEDIRAVPTEKIVGQHPAVAEVARLHAQKDQLRKAGAKALIILDEHIAEWKSRAADTDVARIIIGMRQQKVDALRAALQSSGDESEASRETQ